MGIEPTTSGLDLPLLCWLSYEVGQRKSGTIVGDESRQRESKGTYECCAANVWKDGELSKWLLSPLPDNSFRRELVFKEV